MKRILFIHRSCGANLLRQGRVRELLAQKSTDIKLDDYNQNKSILTDANGNQSPFTIDFIWNDTTPKAYAEFFSVANEDSTMLRRILKEYNTVIIKSCYPNNTIKSDEELEELKGYYKAIAAYFAKHPDKTLGIMTTPPLIQSKTTPDEAKRARQLATWLVHEQLGKNVRVFDFYDLLADPKANMLCKEHQRPWAKLGVPDSHPNRIANVEIAPKFVDWLTEINARASGR